MKTGTTTSVGLPAPSQEREVWVGLLNRLPVGLIGIGESGQAVFCTRLAERILYASDGFWLEQGKVKLGSPRAQRELDGVLVAALELPPAAIPVWQEIMVPRMSVPLPLRLSVLAPAHDWPISLSSPMQALLTLCDPCFVPEVPATDLARTFDLTPKEAELACALAQGVSLADFAHGEGISVHTARSHFRRIKRKMGARDKADVVRAVVYGTLLTSL